jgi:hypothetical protein
VIFALARFSPEKGSQNVLQVLSASTVQLKSGEIIKLTGLYFPDQATDDAGPFALIAIKILKDMLIDQEIVIYQTRNKEVGRVNRMGHSLAHIARKNDASNSGQRLMVATRNIVRKLPASSSLLGWMN